MTILNDNGNELVEAYLGTAYDIVKSVQGSLTEITSVQGALTAITAVQNDLANINAVGNDLSNIDIVAGLAAAVTALGAIAADITAVAGVTTEVVSINAITADIAAVGGISGDISTVAGISGDVTSVAGVASDVTTVAGVTANVATVAGVSTNVSTVAGIAPAVSTVAADGADIGVVAGISGDVSTVAGVSSNVTTVSNISTDVTTVANNFTSGIGFAPLVRQYQPNIDNYQSTSYKNSLESYFSQFNTEVLISTRDYNSPLSTTSTSVMDIGLDGPRLISMTGSVTKAISGNYPASSLSGLTSGTSNPISTASILDRGLRFTNGQVITPDVSLEKNIYTVSFVLSTTLAFPGTIISKLHSGTFATLNVGVFDGKVSANTLESSGTVINPFRGTTLVNDGIPRLITVVSTLTDLSIYVNGVLDAHETYASTASIGVRTTPVRIGLSVIQGTSFIGDVSTLFVSSDVFTAAQVLESYKRWSNIKYVPFDPFTAIAQETMTYSSGLLDGGLNVYTGGSWQKNSTIGVSTKSGTTAPNASESHLNVQGEIWDGSNWTAIGGGGGGNATIGTHNISSTTSPANTDETPVSYNGNVGGPTIWDSTRWVAISNFGTNTKTGITAPVAGESLFNSQVQLFKGGVWRDIATFDGATTGSTINPGTTTTAPVSYNGTVVTQPIIWDGTRWVLVKNHGTNTKTGTTVPSAGESVINTSGEIWDGSNWSSSGLAPVTDLTPVSSSIPPIILTPYDQAVINKSPIVYYKLDEVGGSTFKDNSGFNRDATITGTVSLGSASLIPGDTAGKSADFSGSVGSASPSNFAHPNNSLTVVLTVKGNWSTSGTLFSKFDTVNSAKVFSVQAAAGGQIICSVYSGGAPLSVTTASALNDSNAHLVIFTWNGSTRTVYVDGALSATTSGTAVNISTASGKLTIGALENLTDVAVSQLDGLSVHSNVFSAVDVTNLYNDWLGSGATVLASTIAPSSLANYPVGYSSNSVNSPTIWNGSNWVSVSQFATNQNTGSVAPGTGEAFINKFGLVWSGTRWEDVPVKPLVLTLPNTVAPVDKEVAVSHVGLDPSTPIIYNGSRWVLTSNYGSNSKVGSTAPSTGESMINVNGEIWDGFNWTAVVGTTTTTGNLTASTNISFSTGTALPKATRNSDGLVVLSGIFISTAAITTNSSVASIPAGFRPDRTVTALAVATVGSTPATVRLQITTTGVVSTLDALPDANSWDLASISYYN